MWRWFWVRPNTAETDCYGRVWQWFDVFGRIKSWSGETGWQYDKVMLITLEDLVQNVLYIEKVDTFYYFFTIF